MPWQDVVVMWVKLEPEWTHDDENTATVVDHLHYWLGLQYTRWTADPQDSKVVAARRKRGERPPPMPILRPVAQRPPAAHAAALKRYEALMAENYSNPTNPQQPAGRHRTKQLPARELVHLLPGS